jgi:uncharacterized protein (DUF2062 family)
MPTREQMLAHRWLRPFASHLSSPRIWRFNRRGVARGVALGLFAGFAIPIAQTPFAAAVAVAVRANLPVAALTTFITNPVTVPFIYLGAYFVGRSVIPDAGSGLTGAGPDATLVQRAIDWIVTLAGPTMVGLLIFATVSALLGYAAVHVAWRVWVGQRHRRRQRMRTAGPVREGMKA